jgi:hypothetical protein
MLLFIRAQSVKTQGLEISLNAIIVPTCFDIYNVILRGTYLVIRN